MQCSPHQKSWNSVPARHKFSQPSAHSVANGNTGSLRKVKKKLDFHDDDEEDENGLDFTDKLKAFRGLISPRKHLLVKKELEKGRKPCSENYDKDENPLPFTDKLEAREFKSPKKHVLVKREVERGRKPGSEDSSGQNCRDGAGLTKRNDDYHKFLRRPASAGPGVVKGVGASNAASSLLSGRSSVDVCSDMCLQSPCSAHELATRLEHIEERLQNHEFRSPGHTKSRGLVHSTPVSESRCQTNEKNDEELDRWKRNDDGYQDWKKDSLQHHRTSSDMHAGQVFSHNTDVNNNVKDKHTETSPDIHVLLDRLQKSRLRKADSPYTEVSSNERTRSTRTKRPQSSRERDLIRLERPQSSRERDLVRLERPQTSRERDLVGLERPQSSRERDLVGLERPQTSREGDLVGLERPQTSREGDLVRLERPQTSRERDLVQLERPQTSREGDLVRLERPLSCIADLTHNERDLARLQRPRSCNLDIGEDNLVLKIQHDSVDASIEVASNSERWFRQNGSVTCNISQRDPSVFQSSLRSSVKRELNSSIRQTNVPFFDEIASPSGSMRTCSVNTEPASPKISAFDSERSGQDVDNHVPITRNRTHGIRTMHRSVKDERSAIAGDSRDVQGRQLEYVRHLHNEAVTDDGTDSRASPVDACLQVSPDAASKRVTGSAMHRSSRDRNSEHASEVNSRQKYHKANHNELGSYRCDVDDVQDERKSNLDIDWSDSGAGPLTLNQLRDLHNRAFGNSDEKHVPGSLTGSIKHNRVSRKSEDNSDAESLTNTGVSRQSDVSEGPVNSMVNSEKYNEEYLHHKTTWNREQQSYRRNLKKLNELMERRSITPSYSSSCQTLQENGCLERSLTPATYEMQRKTRSQEADALLSFSVHGIEKHRENNLVPRSKDYDSRQSGRRLESSSTGVEKSRIDKSYSPVSFDKEKKHQSPSRTKKPRYLSGSNVEKPSCKVSDFYEMKKTEKQTGIKHLQASSKYPVEQQRSQTPASYERHLKLRSAHSGRQSADLMSGDNKVRENRERNMQKSVSENQVITKIAKQSLRNQSPPKVKPRVIKREISPNKLQEFNKKVAKNESTASKSPLKKRSSNMSDKSKVDVSHHNKRSNSTEGSRKVVSQARSRVAPLADVYVNSLTDTEKQHLCLDDVRKLHFEVDQQRQDKLFTSFDSDSELSDELSTAPDARTASRNTNTAEKAVVYATESEHFGNRYLDLEQDCGHHDLVSAKGNRGNRNSVEVSADITIPELFGMKITKTINRINNGACENEHRKCDGADIQYEVTISDGKETSQNVTNSNSHKNHRLSKLVHSVTDNDFNTRSSNKLHQSETEHGCVLGIGMSNMLGHQHEGFKRQILIGQMNEDCDTEVRNGQETYMQRCRSVASQDGSDIGDSLCWDSDNQRGIDCASAHEQNTHRYKEEEEDSYSMLTKPGHSEHLSEMEEIHTTQGNNQNKLLLSLDGRKEFLDGVPVIDPVSAERFMERQKQRNIVREMELVDRLVMSRSCSILDSTGGDTCAEDETDSRLLFEPPEKDTSTPLKNYHLTKQDQPMAAIGSLKSPYSAADTIISHLGDPGTVRLLRQLYAVSETARPNLILKARYFKEWQHSVQVLKEQRQYDNTLLQANHFHLNRLTDKYFHRWLEATTSQQQNRKASILYRQIMLRKGLGAFKWAIGRSRHCHDIMQSRVESILLTTSFVKWRRLTEERQRFRLSEAFKAWRNLTVEVQSLRSFEKSMNEKLARRMLTRWKEVYVVCVKQHKADEYSRRTLLKHMFESWTSFTTLSTQQAHRHQVAIEQYQLLLQKKMFGEMVLVYRKYQKARWHYGHRKLGQFFCAWRQVIGVCKLEQEENIRTSTTHWNFTTTRSYFLHWKVVLGNRRAKRMADKNLLRQTFVKWKSVWQQENERRMKIEQRIKMNKVCHAFRCWQKNVVARRRRQNKAVMLLERGLLQQTMLDWWRYTRYKKELNKKLKSYRDHCNQRQLADAFRVWHRQFQQKVDEERARKFWSDKCVVKCVRKWKHVCRKRRLRSLLAETEPDRQLRCLQVMFYRWLATKHGVDVEKCEASDARQILDQCRLRRRFLIWRLATLQALTIKPLILHRQNKLRSKCFVAWLVITRHKAECRRSQYLFMKFKLRQIFDTWRRQYVACQLGKEVRHKTDTGLLIACLQEWSLVLRRKHAARAFNELNSVRHVFTYWKSCTVSQLQAKADARDREEEDLALKRFYFNQWLSNIHEQVSENDDTINMLQQRQAYNRIRRSFAAWRDHLHATFIARAYHKNLCQRLMRTVMVEWHLVADHSLADAVQRFADQLGLPVPDERDSSERSDGSFTSLGGYHSNNRDVSGVGDGDFEMRVSSPRSSSSAACSFRRLFGAGDSSDRSEPDGMSLIGHAFLDSCHIEEKQARAERIKNIVLTVVKRLRHWPVSVLLDQWKEFTARQLELKRLRSRLAEIHHRCILTLALRDWRQNYSAVLCAKKHRSNLLLSRTFSALQSYVQRRKEKTQLLGVARKHHMMVVFQKVFPLWLAKTQQRQHDKHVLHLWSTTTAEEQRLIPLEVRLSREFSRRSLKVCFSIWFTKHKFTAKIKHAYHSGLIKRSFLAWSEWAQKRHEHHQKCVEFKDRRILSMTFKTWYQRLQQKQETEIRYTLAWNSYLQLIIQTWAAWAKANHGRRLLARQLIDKQDENSLRQRFVYWKSVTGKVRRVKTRCDSLLLTSVVQQWRQVVLEKRRVEHMILEFRVNSYTRLVKVLFKRWCSYHSWRLTQKEEQEAYRQNQALVLARRWRKKARVSRGQRLHDALAANKVKSCFCKWKLAFGRCLDREDTLQQHLVVKNRVYLSVALQAWHTHYLGNQAQRVFNLKLQATVLEEWSQWSKASKERRIRGLALQKALAERTLHTYFKYWLGLTQVQQSLRTHVGLKIQTRVLQAWHSYVQRRRQLTDIQNIMTQKVNLRIMTSTFMNMRCQFDYCQGLNDIALKVTNNKNKDLLRKKLRLWQARLDAILASRCYGKFLAVRVVRRWRKFVKKRVDERQMEKHHTELAIRHYNNKICKLAISALYNQVLESRQRKHHGERMAMKYAKLWKHHVDLEYTARCVNEDRLYQKSWLFWRLEFTRRKAAKTVDSYSRRQLLTQVFSAWHRVCQKKQRKSFIPVSVTSGQGQVQTRSSIPVPVGTRSLAESLRRSRNQLIPE
ncbi:uncharacterized protein LOC121389816 [Gigantopelta aegis]|uniref:uncharacterized protein LOC121389816 n=1 Tax=Gigantopelta aegis TaxID=1735272 RepID=UPI001B88B77D|nr:uncharacterized protein LOC121389816 [Gigantopelta aegis]